MNALDRVRAEVDASPRRRARVDDIKHAMQRELHLERLRTERRVTQQELADMLGVSQARVSKLERQADVRMSTLRSYVEALGGSLEVSAVFGDERVVLDLDAVHADGRG